MMRNVILATRQVLERESLEIADYLHRKLLYKSLYAIKVRSK